MGNREGRREGESYDFLQAFKMPCRDVMLARLSGGGLEESGPQEGLQNLQWSARLSIAVPQPWNSLVPVHAEHGFDRYRDTFITRSDSRFTRYVAIYFCQIELGNLRNTAKRQFPNLAFSELVVNVSFIEYAPGEPVTYTLQKFSEFQPSPDPRSNVNQKKYLREKAKEQGDGLVFNIIAPQTANHSMNFTGVMGGDSFWDGTLFMPDFKEMKDEQILEFGRRMQDIMGVSNQSLLLCSASF